MICPQSPRLVAVPHVTCGAIAPKKPVCGGTHRTRYDELACQLRGWKWASASDPRAQGLGDVAGAVHPLCVSPRRRCDDVAHVTLCVGEAISESCRT